jgi:hypothetical protein
MSRILRADGDSCGKQETYSQHLTTFALLQNLLSVKSLREVDNLPGVIDAYKLQDNVFYVLRHHLYELLHRSLFRHDQMKLSRASAGLEKVELPVAANDF